MSTKQVELWRSDFGDAYAQRRSNRITPEGQSALIRNWSKILRRAATPRPENALEVGCNIGRNLMALRHFIAELHGVEPNANACKEAREREELAHASIMEGDGFNLPHADSSIDLVFTSGVLIHVAPDDLGAVTDEIVRVSRQYIVCLEYFSHVPTEVAYHGYNGALFKRDFGKFYLDRYPGLRVLDYGFLWKVLDSADNVNWWLFSKR